MKPIVSKTHQVLIQRLVAPLYQQDSQFSGMAVGVLLNTGQHAWLSSTPSAVTEMVETGLYRGEILVNYEYCKHHTLLFPKDHLEGDVLKDAINSVCVKHNLNRVYCIIRHSQDCSIVAAYNIKHPVLDYVKKYHETVDFFEETLIRFLDETLFIFKEQLPSLGPSRFFSDKNYRMRTIKNRDLFFDTARLTHTELTVLYWTARGKTIEEIALILNLSFHTISDYRRKVIEKLDANNITHAVYLAFTQRLII